MAMRMPVVQVGKMRMAVPQRLVSVAMAVRFVGAYAVVMLMLMMRVMNMSMLMFDLRVFMLMFMRFGEVKIESDRHQRAGRQQLRRHRVTEKQDRCGGSDERRG